MFLHLNEWWRVCLIFTKWDHYRLNFVPHTGLCIRQVNVYAWILIIKVSIAFWLSSGFYSATKALSTPLPCIMIIVLLKTAFLFFVLTSGRPLLVTTFFVFSKPLCSHFAAQIVIREFSVPLQQRCLSLSKGFPLQCKTAKICYCCRSSFTALL